MTETGRADAEECTRRIRMYIVQKQARGHGRNKATNPHFSQNNLLTQMHKDTQKKTLTEERGQGRNRATQFQKPPAKSAAWEGQCNLNFSYPARNHVFK